MRKKKPFFNRLITMTLCVSMVVTSAGIPQLRVEAAKETTDDTVQKPFGEVIGYDADQQAITVVWGNGDADGSLGYSYCISVTGQDTEESYAKEYAQEREKAYAKEIIRNLLLRNEDSIEEIASICNTSVDFVKEVQEELLTLA